MDTTQRPNPLAFLLLLVLAAAALSWGFRPVSSPLLDASPCVNAKWDQWEESRGTTPPQDVEDRWWAECMEVRRTR